MHFTNISGRSENTRSSSPRFKAVFGFFRSKNRKMNDTGTHISIVSAKGSTLTKGTCLNFGKKSLMARVSSILEQSKTIRSPLNMLRGMPPHPVDSSVIQLKTRWRLSHLCMGGVYAERLVQQRASRCGRIPKRILGNGSALIRTTTLAYLAQSMKMHAFCGLPGQTMSLMQANYLTHRLKSTKRFKKKLTDRVHLMRPSLNSCCKKSF